MDFFLGQLTHIPPELEEVEQVVDVHHAVAGEVAGARVRVIAPSWVGRRGVVIKAFWVKAPQIQTRPVVRQGRGIMVHGVGVCAARKQAAEIATAVVLGRLGAEVARARIGAAHAGIEVARAVVATSSRVIIASLGFVQPR